MLSGETSIGKYPVASVKTMAKIAESTESSIHYKKRFHQMELTESISNVTNAISHATCTTAHDLDASAILTLTVSGTTARMISKFRPACPIIGCTTDEKVWRQLNMSWGVTPVLFEEKQTSDELFGCANSRFTHWNSRYDQYFKGAYSWQHSNERNWCYSKICGGHPLRMQKRRRSAEKL
jgi:pyruvate kinase